MKSASGIKEKSLRPAEIERHFDIRSLPGHSRSKTALLVFPPVYDTQYWSEWSQPYGLLRIAALLKKHNYKKIWFYDFMEPDGDRDVPNHRIHPSENYAELNQPQEKIAPIVIEKGPESVRLYKRHFGKPWGDFEEWLRRRGLTSANPPSEVWISSVMSYWWESTRDLSFRLRRYFGKRTKIILGGIYPSLTPEHAAALTGVDIVVAGEVEEANNLWTDLSVYKTKPAYAIITPSRGCPYDCSYCAQKTINAGISKVRFRNADDVVAEMRHKYERYGIRDFAFYADFLLIQFKNNLIPILQQIVSQKLPFRLYAPEGLDTRFLSQSQELLDLMKAAHFQKIYLPVESIDDEYVRTLNRRHVKLNHFVQAARMCEKAGFRLRNLEVNAYVLYGLPEEKIDRVVRTSLFVSEIVGSIIPMLFTPVPSTGLYNRYLPFFRERGWDQDLHLLNGKLFPFVHMNEGALSDYIDLQRLMFMLNAHYRGKSFRLFGDTRVSNSLLQNVRNGFQDFVRQYDPNVLDDNSTTSTGCTKELFTPPDTSRASSLPILGD
jgi:radical SAM superfamily enzyme YgiQ (UPF0313 family)